MWIDWVPSIYQCPWCALYIDCSLISSQVSWEIRCSTPNTTTNTTNDNGNGGRAPSCPSATYWDEQQLRCLPCISGCSRCVDCDVCITCAAGHTLNATNGQCSEVCGDGRRFTLPCDDGNLVNGDGCSNTCQVESGFFCVGGSPARRDTCSK